MKPRRYVLTALLIAGQFAQAQAQDLLSGANKSAAPAAGMPEMFSAGYLVQVVGSLLVVFLCLFAVVFLLKRMNRLGSSSGAALRVIASASLGQREKVVLLEAGEEQLLLGVAPGNVRMLHVLAQPVELADGDENPARFADVLRAANPLGSQS